MKRIVSIQDISCFGKCSLTAALPVISAMGVETAILPTAVLSTHTMFKNPAVLSLQEQFAPISRHWQKLGLTFDAICTGYLASEKEVSLVKEFFQTFGRDGVLRFVDPAMADHGKLYAGFNENFPRKMAELCAEADVIVPNLTEACLLTEYPYRKDYDQDEIREILRNLAALGTRKAVVITGVSSLPGHTGYFGMDVRSGRFFDYAQKKLERSYYGTGDLFASVTAGALMRDFTLEKSLRIAADFVADAILETMTHDPEKAYGVNFETVLPELIKVIRQPVQ